MSFVWLLVLVPYGFVCGFSSIHPLFWWLLLVMALQDAYDIGHKRCL